MRRPASMLLCALLAIAAASASVADEAATGAPEARAILGPPRGRPLSGAELDRRTQEVAALLRCPVCQGLSVADSPTSAASNMKEQLRELLAAGYDEDQALSYFEASYGAFVRLKPPLRGVNWLVWLSPIVGLLAGAAVVRSSLRRLGTPPPAPEGRPAPPPARADPLPDDAQLASYVRRVRELAYGWPGGVRPGSGSPPA